MRRYVIAPAADRALIRRVVQRVDEVLGYPRTHMRGESGTAVPQRAPKAYTETACAVFVHDATGAAILHGAIAVQVDGIADALADRDVDGSRLHDLVVARGWEVRGDLPGVEDAWSQVAPRDGAAGSATGIPEA